MSADTRLLSDFGDVGRDLDFGDAAFEEALSIGRPEVSRWVVFALAVDLGFGLACPACHREESPSTGPALSTNAGAAISNGGGLVAFVAGRVGVFATFVCSGVRGLVLLVGNF